MVSCGGACSLKNSMSTWAFADTAGVPLALLSCSGKVICILTCTCVMIICFSAGICILQGQRLNLLSSLFLTPARISTGTLLEWETLLIPNTYWSISSGCRLCWYCGPQMIPSSRRTRFAARSLAWLGWFGWSSLRELLGLVACLCSVAGGGNGGFAGALRALWRSRGCWVPWWLVLGNDGWFFRVPCWQAHRTEKTWFSQRGCLMKLTSPLASGVALHAALWELRRQGTLLRTEKTGHIPEKIGHVPCPGVQMRDCTGDFWGTCGVSVGDTQQVYWGMPRLWPQAAELENPVGLGAVRLKTTGGSVSEAGLVFIKTLLVVPRAWGWTVPLPAPGVGV